MLIGIRLFHVTTFFAHLYSDYIMLAYWDTDLNKSVDFFSESNSLIVVCTSTIAVCM